MRLILDHCTRFITSFCIFIKLCLCCSWSMPKNMRLSIQGSAFNPVIKTLVAVCAIKGAPFQPWPNTAKHSTSFPILRPKKCEMCGCTFICENQLRLSATRAHEKWKIFCSKSLGEIKAIFSGNEKSLLICGLIMGLAVLFFFLTRKLDAAERILEHGKIKYLDFISSLACLKDKEE